MTQRALRALAAASFSLVAVCHRLDAQDARLSARLDSATLRAVMAIMDSARAARLPTAPLADKALEGAARGSDGGRIVIAVHSLSVRMRAARGALGATATPDEIRIAASALDAGIAERDLARLRAACGKRSPMMHLAVLNDLVGRGVPVPTASDLVLQLARAGVRDADLTLFQRNVRSDIESGADPAVAAATRTRGLIARTTPASTKPQ